MTIKQLNYAVTTANAGNITKAAEELFISQPSLTYALKELEEELGVQIFVRGNKGVTVTRDGEEFLGYARQILTEVDLMEEKYKGNVSRSPIFSVSCQHYSFAVNAFVEVIKMFDADKYDFTLLETETHEIIEDVANTKSEIGILYLSKKNTEVISKALEKNDLIFEELFTARPHVFIGNTHPLAEKKELTLEDLAPYPYLSYEQGEYNSFYYSEEILSSINHSKNIKVRDRATLFNLAVGLNGYTICSGVISEELNGGNIIAKPLKADEYMKIGTIRKKGMVPSRYGKAFLEALKKYV